MKQTVKPIEGHKRSKSHVFHRSNKAEYPVAVRGEGIYLYDETGKRYIDACGGAAVSCLGHSNTQVRKAMHAQIDQLAYAHSGFFTTEPVEALADWLIKRAPKGIERVYFVSGGSEAVEASIKLARQYFLESGKPNKRYVISRWQSYHGNTLGALSAGGNRWRRSQFEPLLVDMTHISPCYEYRLKVENESSEDYGLRMANELEEKILELGADNVMAFFAEPVVGATMGAVPAVDGYFKRIREICTQYDVLLILDEVMCGMGRTGHLFACDGDGVAPDIMTVAKGLGGGYQPIGAMLVQERIYDAITQGSGFFQHGHTYLGHATACSAALAVQSYIEEHDLLANVQSMGAYFDAQLREAFADNPYVGDIRGRGLFRGIEIVENKETKEAFESEKKVNVAIKRAAMAHGLMCYPMGGTIDGKRGDHVLFAPPYVVNKSDIDEIVGLFAQSLKAAGL